MKHLTEPTRGATDRVEHLLSSISSSAARILDRVLSGSELSVADAVTLFESRGAELIALMLVADEARRRTVGEVVSYVHVRNVNFTNICTIGCPFCAFSKSADEVEAETLSAPEVAEKALAAWQEGCTEVCLQGGINPALPAHYYLDLLSAVKARVPDIHIHAFSPFEVLLTANKAKVPVNEWLAMLQAAGLDSMPGTAAEIFDSRVRKKIAPKKLSARQWAEVVKQAHRLGIPTTATIMYGHVDGPIHWAAHLALLRHIQRETGGFTELVPLGFVHQSTTLFQQGIARPGPTGLEDVKMHAVARLMLGREFKNIQVSWVKLGPKLAQVCLNAGANDFGGTLMEERISSAAGAEHGQYIPPSEFRRLIRDLGRIPAQRSTTYEMLRVFDSAD